MPHQRDKHSVIHLLAALSACHFLLAPARADEFLRDALEVKADGPEGSARPITQCNSDDSDTLLKCEMNILRTKLAGCWNPAGLIGAPEPQKLVVVVEFDLSLDGSFASPPHVVNDAQIELSGDPYWKLARQAALDAVRSCEPYDFFSAATYESWKEIRINFNPTDMVGR